MHVLQAAIKAVQVERMMRPHSRLRRGTRAAELHVQPERAVIGKD